MVGLALEGGGVRGSYQAGAYIALQECHIKIDGVCGTSIGALNGAVIASGKGSELPRIWRNLNVGKVFGFAEEYLDCINKKEINFKLLKASFLNIVKILTNKGIELAGLKNLIDQELDIEALLNSPIDFGLVTVRLKDLKPMYLYKEDMAKEKIKDYVLASSFLPIFKMEKLIDDNYYLDGGFYDVGPVNMLLNKGYDQVYLIKIKGLGLHRPYDEKANVIVIEPRRSLGKVLDLNPLQIEENIKMGYYDTLKIIKKLDGYDYVFKPKKEAFFQKINSKVDKKEYRRVKNFFNTKSIKETTIKAVEYIMIRENMDYYEIYNIKKIIKKIKKNYFKNHFIYKYVRNLRLYF